MSNPEIEFAWGIEVAELLGGDRVSGLRLRNVKAGEESILPVTGIFIAIGHDSSSELLAGQLPMNADGYLEVEHPTTRTVIDGVFAAGDVVDHIYRQAVTVAGTGCAAALDAERWLADHEDQIRASVCHARHASQGKEALNVGATKAAADPGMSEQEIWEFLTGGTRTAHVATTRSDGRPHVKPVWFVLDGRPGNFEFLFTTYAESVKGRGLRRNTQVAASVDDPAPPYSFVIIEGTAQLSDRLEDVRAAAAWIGGRYMGEDRAAEFGARNGVPGELLIRLTPARIIAQRAVSG